MALSIGDHVGPYILVECLGRHAAAETWEARADGDSGRRVRLLVAPDKAAAEQWRAGPMQVHRLDHPRIVKTLTADVRHDPPYAAVEWTEGRTLRQTLDEAGKLPVDRAVRVGVKVLGALEYSHGKGAVHGRLNPDNIWIGDEGQVRVLGFGLSAAARPSGPTAAESGDPPRDPYLAPEQVREGRTEEAADLFAVGVMLYEMVVGERRGLRFPMPGAPDWLSSAVETSTRGRAEERYDSAFEMATQLDGRLPAGSGKRGKRPRGGSSPGRGWVPPWRWAGLRPGDVIGLAALLIGAGILLYIFVVAPRLGPPPAPGQPDARISNELLYENQTMRQWAERLRTSDTAEARTKAAAALARFGPDAVEPLVVGLAFWDEGDGIGDALRQIGPKGLSKLDRLAEEHPDLKVRDAVPRARALMSGSPTPAPPAPKKAG